MRGDKLNELSTRIFIKEPYLSEEQWTANAKLVELQGVKECFEEPLPQWVKYYFETQFPNERNTKEYKELYLTNKMIIPKACFCKVF